MTYNRSWGQRGTISRFLLVFKVPCSLGELDIGLGEDIKSSDSLTPYRVATLERNIFLITLFYFFKWRNNFTSPI